VGECWKVGQIDLAALAPVLRRRLKKVINFLRKKEYTPREKILAMTALQIVVFGIYFTAY